MLFSVWLYATLLCISVIYVCVCVLIRVVLQHTKQRLQHYSYFFPEEIFYWYSLTNAFIYVGYRLLSLHTPVYAWIRVRVFNIKCICMCLLIKKKQLLHYPKVLQNDESQCHTANNNKMYATFNIQQISGEKKINIILFCS